MVATDDFLFRSFDSFILIAETNHVDTHVCWWEAYGDSPRIRSTYVWHKEEFRYHGCVDSGFSVNLIGKGHRRDIIKIIWVFGLVGKLTGWWIQTGGLSVVDLMPLSWSWVHIGRLSCQFSGTRSRSGYDNQVATERCSRFPIPSGEMMWSISIGYPFDWISWRWSVRFI